MELSGEQWTYSTVHSSSSTAHFTCTPCTHSSSSIGRVTITLKIPESQSWCLYNALVILTITTQVEQLTSNQRQTYSTYVQKSRTHARTHARTHVHTHARTHTHTHTLYIHTYVYTHMQAKLTLSATASVNVVCCTIIGRELIRLFRTA